MTIQQLNDVREAKPFRPFVLHLADDRAIPVQQPEFLLSTPNGRTIVVCQPDNSLNIIDLLLVTDLEIKATTNGTQRRRRRS